MGVNILNEELYDESELKSIIYNNKIASLSNPEIYKWNCILFDEIEPLMKRYKLFSLGRKIRFSFFIPLFILVSFI